MSPTCWYPKVTWVYACVLLTTALIIIIIIINEHISTGAEETYTW